MLQGGCLTGVPWALTVCADIAAGSGGALGVPGAGGSQWQDMPAEWGFAPVIWRLFSWWVLVIQSPVAQETWKVSSQMRIAFCGKEKSLSPPADGNLLCPELPPLYPWPAEGRPQTRAAGQPFSQQ